MQGTQISLAVDQEVPFGQIAQNGGLSWRKAVVEQLSQIVASPEHPRQFVAHTFLFIYM